MVSFVHSQCSVYHLCPHVVERESRGKEIWREGGGKKQAGLSCPPPMPGRTTLFMKEGTRPVAIEVVPELFMKEGTR